MLQKLSSVHANHKSFLRPKNIHDTRFGIVHFAGDVYYQVEGEHSSGYDPPGNNSGYPRKEEVREERRRLQMAVQLPFSTFAVQDPSQGMVLPTVGRAFCLNRSNEGNPPSPRQSQRPAYQVD